MWGQPYGSPLDAWVATPFVAAMGPTTEALRLPVFLLGLVLVPVAYGLARALHPAAAFPAAVLMACPPPVLPAPRRPAARPSIATTLVLCGLLLLLALRLGDAPAQDEPRRGRLVVWGVLAGLALWTHLMSASAVAASAVSTRGAARGRRRALPSPSCRCCSSSAPWWTRALADREATRIVQRRGPGGDDPRPPPRGAAAACTSRSAACWAPTSGGGGLRRTSWSRARGGARGARALYGSCCPRGAGLAGRAAPRRAAAPGRGGPRARSPFRWPVALGPAHPALPHARCILPVLVARRLGAARRADGRAGAGSWCWRLAALHLAGGARLLQAWRARTARSHPFVLPDLGPARRLLEARGIRARLRVVRPGVPPHLRERRADRGLPALERALPALPAAAARRGAVREGRGLGAHARGSDRPAVAGAFEDALGPIGGPSAAPRPGRRSSTTTSCRRSARRSSPGPAAGPRGTGTRHRAEPVTGGPAVSACPRRRRSTRSRWWRGSMARACCAAWTSR